MKHYFMLILISGVTACQTGVVPISQREYLHEKEGKSPTLGHRRPIEEKSEPRSQIYIKRESLALVPKETKNYTGSLFSLKNPDNLLFIEPPLGDIGDSIEVAIAVNRIDKAKPAAKADPNAAAPAALAGAVKDKDKEAKLLQDELIAALPKLEPGIGDPKIPTSIRMQVVRKLENGDVIVEAARASQNEWEAHSIRAQARLPQNRLRAQKDISTADLADVQWTEAENGSITERESSLWEDEYTMRWSGFNEARSKSAIDLENKRKDMEKVKGRLQERIINLGKERGQIALERERVGKLRQEAEQKLNELNKQVEDKQTLIDQQKETIKKQEQLLETLQQPAESPAALTKSSTPAAGNKANESTR